MRGCPRLRISAHRDPQCHLHPGSPWRCIHLRRVRIRAILKSHGLLICAGRLSPSPIVHQCTQTHSAASYSRLARLLVYSLLVHAGQMSRIGTGQHRVCCSQRDCQRQGLSDTGQEEESGLPTRVNRLEDACHRLQNAMRART